MNLNEFAKKVTEKEGGKMQVNIAQIKEVLKVANALTQDAIYKVIRGTK
jgi:hypothetical protein